MILREDQSAPEAAARALDALAKAGVAPDTAAQLAIAVGAAAVTESWPLTELDFRLARVLWQLGHDDASLALLQRAIPDGRGVSHELLAVPPDLFPLVRSGVLRASAENIWRLDGAAVTRPDVPNELAYARLLSVFADMLAPLWDSAKGSGRLELAGWRHHARLFHSNRRAAARCYRAWRRDIADALGGKAGRRGWEATPDVVIAEPL